MPENFADRLQAAIATRRAPVCVGLDPVFEKLPPELQQDVAEDSERTELIYDFCLDVLEVIAPHVPAVKIQSAYFERYGVSGLDIYQLLLERAQDMGLLVIADVKRNDIGSTAQAYALGHLHTPPSFGADPEGRADAITVNPYLGSDGIAPFIQVASEEGRGVFVLVRTSNPSAREIQDIADAGGKKVFEHVASLVAAMGGKPELVGKCGCSCVGAVVGATYPDEARKLRELMPQQIFLVPGYGAQGATAADCAASFKPDGTGAIVNASRSVLFAYQDPNYANLDWKKAVEQGAKDFAEDIRQAVMK